MSQDIRAEFNTGHILVYTLIYLNWAGTQPLGDDRVDIVVDEAHIGGLRRVVVGNVVRLEELMIRVLEPFSGIRMGQEEIYGWMRVGGDVLRALDSSGVLLHMDLLDHRNSVGIQAVQGVPHLLTKPVHSCLLGEPAQKIVERMILEHQDDDVIDLLQIV